MSSLFLAPGFIYGLTVLSLKNTDCQETQRPMTTARYLMKQVTQDTVKKSSEKDGV